MLLIESATDDNSSFAVLISKADIASYVALSNFVLYEFSVATVLTCNPNVIGNNQYNW